MRALDGVRILDLTRLLPGAYATLLLADLGADVIKIEDPRGGDHARRMPPLADGTSVYFQVLNRNKRSVTLDLRSGEAGPVLDALLSTCDVMVDSFRPRTAVRLGLDSTALRARHPRLICASISGFGHTGPYADRAAHDINYEALVGLLTVANREVTNDQGKGPALARWESSELRPGKREGREGGTTRALAEHGDASTAREPQVPRLLVADIGAAMHAAAGILAALFQRERTGQGAFVEISIHEAALAWMLFPGAPALVEGAQDHRDEVPLTGEAACYNIYLTADNEYLALGALEPKFWSGFCERIGRPDLAPLQAAQGGGQQRVLKEVRAIIRSRTRDEWLAAFADADVCLTEVKSFAEVLRDPHLAERGVFSRDGGTTHIRLSGVDVRPAPSLGADTDDVLAAVGFDHDARERLRREKVL